MSDDANDGTQGDASHVKARDGEIRGRPSLASFDAVMSDADLWGEIKLPKGAKWCMKTATVGLAKLSNKIKSRVQPCHLKQHCRICGEYSAIDELRRFREAFNWTLAAGISVFVGKMPTERLHDSATRRRQFKRLKDQAQCIDPSVRIARALIIRTDGYAYAFVAGTDPRSYSPLKVWDWREGNFIDALEVFITEAYRLPGQGRVPRYDDDSRPERPPPASDYESFTGSITRADADRIMESAEDDLRDSYGPNVDLDDVPRSKVVSVIQEAAVWHSTPR